MHVAGVNIKEAFVTCRYLASNGMTVVSSSHIFCLFAGRKVWDVFTVSAVGVTGVSPLIRDIELSLMGGIGVEASI